ncbi:MAG: DUF2489 domain-containing protein [Cellvibrionaceae bacterium]|nr:DUF2489 domain-containing protein [Cellvibrionaceae bacterium]
MMFVLLCFALVVVIVLAVVAAHLLWKVRQMERRQSAQAQERRVQAASHRQYINNSIQILALGIIDDQLSLTEGAMRISVLLGNLELDEAVKEEFSAFFQLADATAHIPILDAWKKLSARERFAYDKQRKRAEEKHSDFVVDAAKRIRGQIF